VYTEVTDSMNGQQGSCANRDCCDCDIMISMDFNIMVN